MKKILFIVDKPNLYGSEQHVLKLMIGLREDHEVSLLALAKGPMLNKLSAYGLSFSVIPTKWYSLNQLSKLFKFIKRGNFDIIHAHQPKAMLWASILSRLALLPCIVTVHSLPQNNVQSYSNWSVKLAVGIFHYFVKFIAEALAAKVIYLSEFSFANAHFKSKSEIIPNWIDNVIEEHLIKTEFGSPIRLVSVGSLSYNKGMDRLIESLALIRDKNWVIKIVGDSRGDYGRQLHTLASKLGIRGRIEFTGYIEDINNILLQADGFILLSRGETFGLVYIEAMNCGLPVVAWDIPVIKEIVPSGNVIMSKNDDIKKIYTSIYSSQANFRKLAESNKKFVISKFAFDQVYTRYLNLYDQVLSHSSN